MFERASKFVRLIPSLFFRLSRYQLTLTTCGGFQLPSMMEGARSFSQYTRRPRCDAARVPLLQKIIGSSSRDSRN
jgi:hypothetical protein